jgi:hypothetical protein
VEWICAEKRNDEEDGTDTPQCKADTRMAASSV